MNGNEIDRAVFRADVAASVRYFCREFGYATWALLLGVGIGVFATWFVWHNWLSGRAGVTALVSLWVVLGAGMAADSLLRFTVKLIRALSEKAAPVEKVEP